MTSVRIGSRAVKRLWALQGATLNQDTSLMMLGLPPGPLAMPVPFFLIEHDRGLLLYDTAMAPSAAEDPAGTYGPLLTHMGLEFEPEQRIDRRLATLGLTCADVTHVVLSHPHWDHAGGLHLFPHAKLYAGADDLPFALWPHTAAFEGHFRREDIELTRGFDWHPLHGDHDVFGDGSVQILSTPGHTPGHQSLLLTMDDGPLILTGDAVHLQIGLTQMLPSGWDWSTDRAVRSIQRLRTVAEALDAAVWVNHDPEDWARFGGGGEVKLP